MPISSFLTDNHKTDTKSGKAIYYHAVGVVFWGSIAAKTPYLPGDCVSPKPLKFEIW